MRARGGTALLASLALILSGCGGGGSSPSTVTANATPTPSATPGPVGSGGVYSPPAQVALTTRDVQRIIAQAVGEAKARNLPSVIAVVDRVGNVLAVFKMTGARDTAVVSKLQIGGMGTNLVGLQGKTIPATAAAIAKAITGAYLSSGGNAFSTRTASEIIQQHFPPAPTTQGLESGPLFGVQISNLPCSDLSARYQPAGGASALIGPKRSPLGLSADPGGFPLYKNGVLVGGIGVMGDGDYGFDPNVLDTDIDAEEYIALAGTQGFTPPDAITADKVHIDGTSLRYSDAVASQLSSLATSYTAADGQLVAVTGYVDAAIHPGTAYGSEASGVRQARASEFADTDAFVLTDGSGHDRFPIRGGTDGAVVAHPLTATEVRDILEEAFKVLSRARAQIREPLDSHMQATISVVDTYGNVLGIVRSPDGPLFGTDVSLQKARTATFFSNPVAAQQLLATPDVAHYVQRVRDFLNDQNALTGTVAFADRSGGNLSRPFFPDGEDGLPPGPLSVPTSSQFNPFATGLQTNLVLQNIMEHLKYIATNGADPDTPVGCTQLPQVTPGHSRLANGTQVFPGSVPIYRGNTLVGGIGVSGDGVDQDDMVSFLGMNNGGVRAGTVNNAPNAMRADRVVIYVNGSPVRLRFVNCPFAPFLDTSEQNVCQGL